MLCPPPPRLQHYSVDVVVAFYTVPLVFYTMHRRWTTKRPVQDYWCAVWGFTMVVRHVCVQQETRGPTSLRMSHPCCLQFPPHGLVCDVCWSCGVTCCVCVYMCVLCVCRPHRPLLGEEEVELAELGDIESGDADGGKMDVSWGERCRCCREAGCTRVGIVPQMQRLLWWLLIASRAEGSRAGLLVGASRTVLAVGLC